MPIPSLKGRAGRLPMLISGRCSSVSNKSMEDYPGQRLWDAIPETASRLRGRIEAVLDWAATRGYRSGDNPARWDWTPRQRVARLGAARFRKVEHQPALDIREVPAFMAALRSAQRRSGTRA